jgi:mevalonate kinase
MTNQSSISNHQSAIRASAPGSLMLLGEHAVLHGRRALVCAINKRITVLLSQINKPVLRIVSDLGTYEAPLGELTDHPDFRFVLDAVKQYPLEQGIELKIESEFSSDIGFGSSAAVTVATHAALMKSGSFGELAPPGRAPSPTEPFQMELFKRSLATIHRVQGRGSGADVAASVFGGVVAYRAEPLEIKPLKQTFPLTAVYSGSKMKTAEVIALVELARAANPEKYERIFDGMDASVGEVLSSFGGTAASPSAGTEAGAPPLQVLGEMLVCNQKLMEEMGLCNAALAEIIESFQALGTPAKISGSGLGDCAIGLGRFPLSGKFPAYFLQVFGQGAVAF